MAIPTMAHDRRIRIRGIRLWREDGCPPGRMDEFLERARELQAFEDHPNAALLPNPMTLHHGEVEPEQPVEEAALMENLGEFPGRSDQGDRSPVPMTRRRALDKLRDM
ncbi:MAG TPA: hypothetical protein VMU81_31320 [Acetobacteraceae bacterium]|nr:hypothetical protein [Acetobacteraceae bacterium]